MGWRARLLIGNHDSEVAGGGDGGGGGGGGGGVGGVVNPSASASTSTLTLTLFTLDDDPTTPPPTQNTSTAPSEQVSAAWGSYLSTLCDLLHQRLSSLAGLFQSVQGAQINDESGVDARTVGSGNDSNGGAAIGGGGSGSGGGRDDDQLTNTPLCHGVLLAIRYCLIDLHATRGHTSNPTLWRDINQR